jgi:hypothetical protein
MKTPISVVEVGMREMIEPAESVKIKVEVE